MQEYLDLVRHVLDHGVRKPSRTGVDTLACFAAHYSVDLARGFPLLTTKKMQWDSLLRELLWYLSGEDHIRSLRQHTPIWDAWADENGELGPIYGFQWRNWGGTGIDQIRNAIDLIKKDPSSRRILVSAWNVADVPKMRLPPCHLLFQFYVSRERYLSCQLYQRSADIALGVPFNIASYALLTMMMAAECGLEPGDFVHTLGDAHVYKNHVEGLRIQLQRKPLALPRVTLAKKPLDEMRFEDIELLGYEHHPFIKFPIAV